MTAQLTSGCKLAINDDGTAVGSFTQMFAVESSSLRKQSTILDSAGITGTRSHRSERTRNGGYFVGGDIVLHPSPADLDILLPYIMGAAESTDVFAFGETLDSQEFSVLEDVGNERHVFDDCKVSRAVFRSTEGDFLTLTMSVLGKTFAESATAFPSISIGLSANNAPYVHSDLAVTLEGTGSRVVLDFELTIDHVIKTRFANSLTPTHLIETDRIVSCKCTVPYDSNAADLFDVATAGAAASFVYTNGNMSLTFTLAKFQIPTDGPQLRSRNDEEVIELNGVARMSSTTRELVITNDSTA